MLDYLLLTSYVGFYMAVIRIDKIFFRHIKRYLVDVAYREKT